MGNKLVTSFAPVVFFVREGKASKSARKKSCHRITSSRARLFSTCDRTWAPNIGLVTTTVEGHVFTQKGHKEFPRGRLLAWFDTCLLSTASQKSGRMSMMKKMGLKFPYLLLGEDESSSSIGKWFFQITPKAWFNGMMFHGHGGEGTTPRGCWNIVVNQHIQNCYRWQNEPWTWKIDINKW